MNDRIAFVAGAARGVTAHVADVRDPAQLEQCVAETVDRSGRLDVVTACAVSPGATRTVMLEATAAIHPLPDSAVLASHQLLRRLLDPDEVAAAIGFCCSREGAVVNDSVVHADGGFTP